MYSGRYVLKKERLRLTLDLSSRLCRRTFLLTKNLLESNMALTLWLPTKTGWTVQSEKKIRFRQGAQSALDNMATRLFAGTVRMKESGRKIQLNEENGGFVMKVQLFELQAAAQKQQAFTMDGK